MYNKHMKVLQPMQYTLLEIIPGTWRKSIVKILYRGKEGGY
jgi:hypothetical protein